MQAQRRLPGEVVGSLLQDFSRSSCAPEVTRVPLRLFVLCGALQVLRLEARGLAGAAPSAALCTRPAGSGTPPASKMFALLCAGVSVKANAPVAAPRSGSLWFW